MIKQLSAFITILFFFQVSFGQQDIIPKQYQSIKEVYGDLDKDGIQEKVVVYNMSDKEDEINGIDREVVIFKKDKDNNEWKNKLPEVIKQAILNDPDFTRLNKYYKWE